MKAGSKHRELPAPKPVKELTHHLTRLWWQDYFLSILLVGLVVTVFVVYPLGQYISSRYFLIDGLFTLIVISGVLAVARGPLVTFLMVVIALASLAVRWINTHRHVPGLDVWDAGLSILTLLVLTVVVLIQVFRPGRITPARILGAVAAYLLLGILWAFAYNLLQRFEPNAFQLPQELQPASGGKSSLLYFSFVTLTTVGYGDILPIHPVARSLANLEALIGQLFPAILIARLVSLEIIHRADKPPADAE